MPKNIILCSDGTGNSDVKGRGTNVFKLFEAVDLNGYRIDPKLDAQLAFYDDGVGTEGNALVKAVGGAAGLGLARNVRKLYRELSRVYDPGDRIYLFGFSRGAFTVRTLAGMISFCGVLKGESITTARSLHQAVENAYATYRARYWSYLTRVVGTLRGWPDQAQALADFRRRYETHQTVPIEFLGVWDTVDAVGMPFALAEVVNQWIVQFKFPNRTLGTAVKHAYHALSLDDDRRSFKPVLWKVAPGDDTTCTCRLPAHPRLEQVWFAGVHSNVGGGYPKQGMSLVALDWMLCHAAGHGLRLQRSDHELFRGHASVDDMLYDPRAGLGVFYRWAPRDIRTFCKNSKVAAQLHVTVGERIAHGTADYAPGNLPRDLALAITPPDPLEPDAERKLAFLAARAHALEAAMQRALRSEECLLDQAKADLFVADCSYWTFMAGWLAVLVAAYFLVRGTWLQAGVASGVPVAAFLVAWRVAAGVDGRMSDRFSDFWQRHRPSLRAALKQAQLAGRGAPPPTDGARPAHDSRPVDGAPGSYP